MKISTIRQSKARAKYNKHPSRFAFVDNTQGTQSVILPKAMILVRSTATRQVVINPQGQRTTGWRQLRGVSRKSYQHQVIIPDWDDPRWSDKVTRDLRPFNRSKYNPVTEALKHAPQS